MGPATLQLISPLCNSALKDSIMLEVVIDIDKMARFRFLNGELSREIKSSRFLHSYHEYKVSLKSQHLAYLIKQVFKYPSHIKLLKSFLPYYDSLLISCVKIHSILAFTLNLFSPVFALIEIKENFLTSYLRRSNFFAKRLRVRLCATLSLRD